MRDPDVPATEPDLHDLASALPHVQLVHGPSGNPVFQVGRKSFVYFRTPRPDAFDPATGARYTDVVLLRVGGEDAKQALVQDPSTPFFTTPHFDGYPGVLVRLSRLSELTRAELAEVVENAWLAQASERRRRAYLDGGHRITEEKR